MNDSIKFFTRMGDGSGVYMTEKEGNVVGVKRRQDVVSTSDSGCFKVNYQAHIPIDRSTAVLVNERILCMDSVDIGNIDYSYKTVKPILHDEAKIMELAQSQAVIPVLYGGMPDLGRYTKPDGPVENWSELLPQGKMDEAQAAQEIWYCVCSWLKACGCLRRKHMLQKSLV